MSDQTSKKIDALAQRAAVYADQCANGTVDMLDVGGLLWLISHELVTLDAARLHAASALAPVVEIEADEPDDAPAPRRSAAEGARCRHGWGPLLPNESLPRCMKCGATKAKQGRRPAAPAVIVAGVAKADPPSQLLPLPARATDSVAADRFSGGTVR